VSAQILVARMSHDRVLIRLDVLSAHIASWIVDLERFK
jgi:hypothetical protein